MNLPYWLDQGARNTFLSITCQVTVTDHEAHMLETTRATHTPSDERNTIAKVKL